MQSGWLRFDPGGQTSPRRLAMLAGIGLLLLLLTLWLLDGEDQPPPAPAPQPAAPPPVAAPLAAPAAPSPPVAVDLDQMTLHGVMGRGESGAAIIGVAGNQRLVRTGREIVPGVRLKAISADHALLVAPTGEFRLHFPEAGGRSTVRAAPRAAGADPERRAFEREAILYQRAMVPAPVEGRVGGYRLQPGELPPAFARLGLRPGDIVIRVAGTRLEGPDDVERIPRAIRASERVPVEFVRDGETRIIYSRAE